MLPPKVRQSIWGVASKLYPTFSDLLGKVQEMIREEADSKDGSPYAMDIDDLEEPDGKWEETGQTFIGKGPKGEDVLFALQKRGNFTRVVPKKGKEERAEAKVIAKEAQFQMPQKLNGIRTAAPGAGDPRTGRKSVRP